MLLVSLELFDSNLTETPRLKLTYKPLIDAESVLLPAYFFFFFSFLSNVQVMMSGHQHSRAIEGEERQTHADTKFPLQLPKEKLHIQKMPGVTTCRVT
jgi:hypothetical protein